MVGEERGMLTFCMFFLLQCFREEGEIVHSEQHGDLEQQLRVNAVTSENAVTC